MAASSEENPIGDPQAWLAACRAIVAEHRSLFAESRTIAERTVYEENVGAGGDHTLKLDTACEDVVFAELEKFHRAGLAFKAISEERGEVVFGDGGSPVRVVVDPIDGSLNVRRTLPSHSLSIAVADGDTIEDVRFGFVHDFGADEEFWAAAGVGAHLDGRPIKAEGPGYGLEVVGLESAKPGWIAPIIESLDEHAYRVRSVGSIAITLSYVAAGRLDGMLTARGCRSVDVAAAQLIAREAGASVEYPDVKGDCALDLSARYQVIAAVDHEHLSVLRAAQARTGA
jgi:myo-inositol-1(or 4)-monophosphatase